jgi:hypothetical protein
LHFASKPISDGAGNNRLHNFSWRQPGSGDYRSAYRADDDRRDVEGFRESAGQPGWASIIPIYNLYIWCKIVGRPAWWIILMLIPLVNIIVGIVLCIDMAKSFGKGVGFGIGLAFLGIIFLPILGFGSAQYQGAAAAAPNQGAAVSQPPQSV